MEFIVIYDFSFQLIAEGSSKLASVPAAAVGGAAAPAAGTFTRCLLGVSVLMPNFHHEAGGAPAAGGKKEEAKKEEKKEEESDDDMGFGLFD